MTDTHPIFNILLTGGILPSKIAGKLATNIQSFKDCYPTSKYTLFRNKELRRFIETHFESDVLKAYDSLVPFAYKADLGRYCLLYVLGGVYADLSHLHINAIPSDQGSDLVAFRAVAFIHPPHTVSNGLIYARPGLTIFRQAIDRIVQHCRDNFYGNSPLDPTGPDLFGRCIARTANPNNIIFGDSSDLLAGSGPPKSKKHIFKFLPDGELVAYRNKRTNSSIEELVKGGNAYGQLWRDRGIYQ